MKILYIGPYREGTGAAKASLHLIRSLQASGIELAIRPIKFNDYQPDLSPDILELENKTSAHADFLIQNVPANMLVYNNAFKKNIAYINYHTDNFQHTDWPERLNLMDEVWVPSEFVMATCRRSGVLRPIKVIPIGCDENIFLQNYQEYPQIKKERHGDFLFYTISSSFSRRKNFGAFLKAFHLEFDRSEPVNAVIKFNKTYNPNEMSDREFINQLKRGLKLGETKEEILLPSHYLTDNEIYSIHNSCNVFVSSSYGEGWCIPAFEAMSFGKTPIVNSFGGYDYIDHLTGWRVPHSLEPVFGMEGNSLFTGRELWASISIPDLRKSMREAYEMKEQRESKMEHGLNKMFDYNYPTIGSLIKKALYE